MRWTIAILTIPQRSADLERLLSVLEPQIGDRDIEIIISRQNWSIADKRQWCLDTAQGEYFNFIDDDDLVAEDYVDSIYPLLDGVDYVGFILQHYLDGIPSAPQYNSICIGEQFDGSAYFTWPNHVNPIRTEIARQARFITPPHSRDGRGEDWLWSQQVHPKTEHFIKRPMYFYLDHPSQSASRGNV
jgi:hypothetical protein